MSSRDFRRRRRSRTRSHERRRRMRSRSPRRDRRRRSRTRSRSRERRRRRSRSPHSRSRSPTPTKYIAIKRCPPNVTEDSLRATLRQHGAIPVKIEFQTDQNNQTKQAVIEFVEKRTAKEFMERRRGRLEFENMRCEMVFIEVSKPNWLCDGCWFLNSHIVSSCAQCGQSQTSTCIMVNHQGHPLEPGKSEVSHTSTEINLCNGNNLIMHSLHLDNKEGYVRQVLAHCNNTIQRVHIVRFLNFVGKDVAFIRFATQQQCIDANAAYQKMRLNGGLKAQIALPGVDARISAQVSSSRRSSRQTISSVPRTHNSAYNQLRENLKRTSETVRPEQQIQIIREAINQHKKSEIITTVPTASATPSAPENNYPQAIHYGLASVFKWDPESGCFYDSNSGYYFDIHRKLYYFDAMYYDWDETQMKYVPVPNPSDTQQAKPGVTSPNLQPTTNSQGTNQIQPLNQTAPLKMAFKTKLADQLKNIQQQKLNQLTVAKPTKPKRVKSMKVKVLKQPKTKKKKAPSFKQGYIDYNKLCCLLCKRKFKNKEKLEKHELHSDLHKSNLAKQRKTKKG